MNEEEPYQYLAARIHDAIAADPRVNMLDVEVRVVGQKVFVRGQVPTQDRRDAIADVARELAPDHEIHNEVDVFVAETVGVEALEFEGGE